MEMDLTKKSNESCNLVNFLNVTYLIFLNQFSMTMVKKASTDLSGDVSINVGILVNSDGLISFTLYTH